MQSGRHSARTIVRRLRGREPKAVSLSSISARWPRSRGSARSRASDASSSRGFVGWLLWLVVHLAFLTGFKNRAGHAGQLDRRVPRARPTPAHHHQAGSVRARARTRDAQTATSAASCHRKSSKRQVRDDRRQTSRHRCAGRAARADASSRWARCWSRCSSRSCSRPASSAATTSRIRTTSRSASSGPPAQTAPLRAGVEKAAGSAFDIRPVATVADAAHEVRQRDLNAAFVPTANPKQPASVIVASANGRIVATAAETLARAVTAAQGGQLVVREVRPLPAGDEIGLGVFMFMIVCTICGYITPTILETLAPALLTKPPLRDHRGDRGPGVGARLPDRRAGVRHIHRLGRDDPRVHRRRRAVRVHHRPGHPPAAGTHRSVRDLHLARDLRVPQHREPRRHLHRPRARPASGGSSTTSGSEHKPSTPNAASSTSAGKEPAPTSSDSSPGPA